MSGRVLVAYASKYGGTAEIAQAIAEAMRAEGLDAEAREAATVTDLTGYDAAVVGSGVYMGRWAPDARHFVKQHRAALRAMPTWLFCSGPTGGSPEGDEAVRKAGPGVVDSSMKKIDVGARGYATFAGRNDERMAGMLARWMPKGDWRDFDQVAAWGRQVARELAGQAAQA
jgi:menaquinone-dependent protoporphyrinogen oxidase